MVATFRNLTSSSSTAEYFRADGGHYVGEDCDAESLRAKREELREASAWHDKGAELLGCKPSAQVIACPACACPGDCRRGRSRRPAPPARPAPRGGERSR